MEESKSVPVGLPVGQNKPPVYIASQAHPRESIAYKNCIVIMALKRADFAGLGKTGEKW
jgi:hypothetical protein